MAHTARTPEDSVIDIPVDIVIESGRLTVAETAALTAVLSAAVREESSETPDQPATIDGWESSRRLPRRPITPGAGAWQSWLANI
ncbi:MAG: acyl-CoA carboxylase subunit epsilon [Microbacteriaceae bacterium]